MEKPIFKHKHFLSFYGDDFTGSTDVLETLALNGIPAALFLEAPEISEVEAFELKVGVGATKGSRKIKAFGVAGVSRSLNPGEMDHELPPIFEKISAVKTDFFHYKVCSTFDSAVNTGNIGHAVELALKYFPASYIPLLVGAPFLNRFVVFGNLFARVHENTYRLDRHPTMSKHPVTPMTESDLRLHLKQQTTRPMALVDQFALEEQYGDVQDYLKELINGSGGYVLFDTTTVDHLTTIGKLLMTFQNGDSSLLVGSSGVEYALAFYLQQQAKISSVKQVIDAGEAPNMVVTAGSAAPGTAEQIRHMETLGHTAIRLKTEKLLDPMESAGESERSASQAVQCLERKQVPMLYTALGPDDPAIRSTAQAAGKLGLNPNEIGSQIAQAQGKVLKEIIHKAGKLRVARVLGIYALETLCPIAPGAPLCVAHSNDPLIDGLEIALKGGQNGNEKYFESIYKGKPIN